MKKLYALLGVLVCIALCVLYLWHDQRNLTAQDDAEFTSQSELYLQVKPPDDTPTNDANTPTTTDNILACEGVNLDTVAWLTIPNTNVDFPVVQTLDNEYYLSHGFDGEPSQYGVPFLDYRCASDFSDYNSIVYGHNITGERMFAGLLNFQDSEYFNSHSFGYLTTKDSKYKVHFVACLVLKSDSFVYNTVFLTPQEREVFADDVRSQATQYRDFPDVELSEMNLLTLSTCSYEFTDARTVLIGFLEEVQ